MFVGIGSNLPAYPLETKGSTFGKLFCINYNLLDLGRDQLQRTLQWVSTLSTATNYLHLPYVCGVVRTKNGTVSAGSVVLRLEAGGGLSRSRLTRGIFIAERTISH